VISILLPTLRVGGLDVLCDSLSRQTCQDFELLLADGIHRYRAPLVADKLAVLPFPVRHLASDGIALSNYSRSINDAVVVARGDVILMMPDYAWLADDTVEIHARFHDEHRGERKCLMSGYTYRACPPRHPGFEGYHPRKQHSQVEFHRDDPEALWELYTTREAERYERDLASGALDALMWSIWAEPLTLEALQQLPIEHEHKLFDVEWSHRFCSLKNESYPIEAWEELNGLDEDLDGSHLYQDLEWGERLHRTERWTWERIRGGEITVVNPRPFFACKRMLRPLRLNESIAELKRVTGAAVNPGWSLRERRAAHHAV